MCCSASRWTTSTRASARVPELGGTASGPANDMPWGQRVAHVRDPDGNAVNLTSTS
ncbi:VOC family protein [Geodermatophilus sp. CPCC 205506]|uniref:VOC family protein n=1 Tax=Geodermatophilus sp. CPCC 205506 TaxID=2936596 RepID=UPI003F5376B5